MLPIEIVVGKLKNVYLSTCESVCIHPQFIVLLVEKTIHTYSHKKNVVT
jgi:hypothetical protein